MLGMPRQIYTYPPGLGWESNNAIETIGSFILALGILVVIIDFIQALIAGSPAPDNPWAADTLEWAVSSPPPPYNFLRIPVVRSREPMWDQPELAAINDPDPDTTTVATAAPPGAREAVSTSVLDAESPQVIDMAEDSYLPLMLAFGLLVTFIGLLPGLIFAQVFIAAIGLLITATAIFLWFWPSPAEQGA
jgi:cytochrome c oxidase subunit I+III